MPDQPDEMTRRQPTPANTMWHLSAMRSAATPDVVSGPTVVEAEAPTVQRAAVTAPTKAISRPLIPATITLPVIPKDATTQPRLPAVLSPHAVQPDNDKLESHPTHPITVVTPKFRTPGPRALPLPARKGAPRRAHRAAWLTIMGVVLVLALAFVPVVHGAGGKFSQWFALASSAEFPTPTPVLYPDHPVASGVGDFICVALPFARLVQKEQAQDGLPHPWYVSVILAQWGFEQGWNIPGYTGYNWGNSSAIPGFPSIGGTNQPGSPGAFAYAYSPLQGVAIYETFTKMNFYVGVWQAYPNGPVAQAEALGQSPWDAGHYQEGGGQPGQSLLNAMNDFNLYRFDNPNASC
jgi:hypothetical protein